MFLFSFRQTCSVWISNWNLEADWLVMNTSNTYLELHQQPMPYNSIWQYLDNHCEIVRKPGEVEILFHFSFQRNPSYFGTNLFAPGFILGILQLTTFMLPPDTPDRAMFTITIMLTEFVLKSEIMSNLPETPKPIYLSYYTLAGIVLSSAITAYSVFIAWLCSVKPQVMVAEKTKWHFSLISLVDFVSFFISCFIFLLMNLITAWCVGLFHHGV